MQRAYENDVFTGMSPPPQLIEIRFLLEFPSRVDTLQAYQRLIQRIAPPMVMVPPEQPESPTIRPGKSNPAIELEHQDPMQIRELEITMLDERVKE